MKNTYDVRKKVIFVLPSLAAGGAERVMSYIAQNLNPIKYDVTLIVFGFEKDKAFEVNNIDVRYLNKSRVVTGLIDCMLLFKRLKPSVVISVLNLNIYMGIISVLFPKCKFVGRIVNVVSVLKDHPEEKNRYIPSFINKLGNKGLDYVICQSQDMYEDVLKTSDFKKNKLVIINNPITKSFQVKKQVSKKNDNNIFRFTTVGSLEPRKGHLRVLDVLSKLNNVDFQYTIIGKGSQEETIFNRIRELNLANKITHVPYTNDVASFLTNSDLFLQGSYVEGFPNALIETCAVGTPAVVFDAPGGINEIIQDGINGYIAKDEEDFKSKINIALSKEWNPQDIHDSVFKKYNTKTIIGKYEELIDSCIED